MWPSKSQLLSLALSPSPLRTFPLHHNSYIQNTPKPLTIIPDFLFLSLSLKSSLSKSQVPELLATANQVAAQRSHQTDKLTHQKKTPDLSLNESHHQSPQPLSHHLRPQEVRFSPYYYPPPSLLSTCPLPIRSLIHQTSFSYIYTYIVYFVKFSPSIIPIVSSFLEVVIAIWFVFFCFIFFMYVNSVSLLGFK